MTTPRPAPLSFKPDLEDADRRWQASFAGEIIDRPVVCVTAPKEGFAPVPGSDYHERAYGDMDGIIDRAIRSAEAVYWGGEAVPSYFLSFGPDEIAVFTGAPLCWSQDSGDTNWSKPFISDWERDLPLRLQADHPLWQRMLTFYHRASERMAGKMLLTPPDLHTNMDLLAAVRGPQALCLDLIDRPRLIDRAMEDARRIFRELWAAVVEAGRMESHGFCHGAYSMEGAAVLQCDFSCMMSPEMFRRWVMPALEEEAAIVRHAIYHWDGPGALSHTDTLLQSRGLYALSYVPGSGRGTHLDYIDLFKKVQAGGKTVQIWGGPEEIRLIHRELRPERAIYSTWASSPAEADRLLEWFVRNT